MPVSKEEIGNRIASLKKDYKASIEYALYKMDDKPHIAWADLLAAAHMSGDQGAIESMEIMAELSLTPQEIKKYLKGKKLPKRR